MATPEQLAAAAEGTAEQLMLADRLDEEGRWEEAAWRRLWAGSLDWLEIGPSAVMATENYLHVSDYRGDWLWSRSRQTWKTWTRRTLAFWVQHNEPPPSWVRRAVEEAAAQAVALALASLST